MVVCKFWQQGNCRYGDNCRFEHTRPDALTGPESFSTVAESIAKDMAKGNDRSDWAMTVYAPLKHAPNLVDGTDLSPEELRFQAYQARATNTMDQYARQESEYVAKMEDVFNRIAANPLSAYRTFFETRRPFNAPPAPPQQAPVSAFGQRQAGAGFGAFASQTPSAFGQASAFGQQQAAPTSAFGQPVSAFGAAQPQQPSAFGQQPSSSPAFGQSTAFGQSNAFGAAPSAPATGGFAAFATQTPSSFSAPTGSAFSPSGAPSSAFGQPGPSQSGGAFGQSTPSAGAFGRQGPAAPGAFGQQASSTGAFGQAAPSPGAFGQPAPTTGAFGQVAPTTGAFGGGPGPAAAGAFGGGPGPAAGAFGQSAGGGGGFSSWATNAPTAFGQSPQTQPQQSAFGSQQSPATQPTSAFGQQVAPAPPTQPAFGGAPSAFAPGPSSQPAPTSAFSSSSNPSTQRPVGKWPPRDPNLLSVDRWASDAGREEDLDEEAREAFKAQDFAWGKVPWLPPPLSLR